MNAGCVRTSKRTFLIVSVVRLSESRKEGGRNLSRLGRGCREDSFQCEVFIFPASFIDVACDQATSSRLLTVSLESLQLPFVFTLYRVSSRSRTFLFSARTSMNVPCTYSIDREYTLFYWYGMALAYLSVKEGSQSRNNRHEVEP